jgi:hypothetical protein
MAIPVTPEYEVNVGKSKESQDFGFHFSAKLARTLAETLYDYKVEAVVREYSTNITDSHTDAGFPEKAGFVHVPTKLNPVIKFQDFGIGMTKETIFKIYTVFGKSTKEHDNTTNGSLGYGSKSAFSVSEQFTVTSVKDSIKTVVVCYKDRTGLPKADVKLETKTTEVNGTVVEIPVKLSQVPQWQEACARVLGAFRVPHNVNTFGNYQDEYEAILNLCEQVREEGSVFVQSPSIELSNHRSRTLALMGDVLYHLPDFESLVGKTKIKNLVGSFVENGMYVTNFNIGDLDHAPSREAISYDPQTFNKVRRRVNSDIKKEFRKFTKDINFDLSFYKFYKQYHRTNAWTLMKNLELPITRGNVLAYVDPSRKGEWKYKQLMFLLNEEKYGKIRGIIPSTVNSLMFAHSVESMYQDRLIKINNPIVIYSEKEKGFYKIKDTLENVNKHFEGRHVLAAECKEKAENIAKWFGSEDVVCGDEYSPEKKVHVKGEKSSRGTYGIKEDYETVATYIELMNEGWVQSTGKVNLSEKGVYWASQDSIVVKGIVPRQETTFSTYGANICKMLKVVEGTKVVFKNLNNKGKIERSGIEKIDVAVQKVVKKHKQDLVKYLSWKNNPFTNLTKKEMVLVDNKPSHVKIKQQIQNRIKPCEKIELISSLSDFHLNKTKMFEKQVSIKKAMFEKVKLEVENTMSKLPLTDKFSDCSQSNIEKFKYYLKLEKVIK